MEEQTITTVKTAFLRSQVRLLSAPLEPSTQWRDLAAESEQGHLSEKSIQNVVAKVNEKLKQHNRMIFSAQSQRLVAEQIESLHWTLVDAESKDADINTLVVKRDADLTEASAIEALPADYEDLYLHPDHHDLETDADEPHAETYTALREELLELVRKRDMLKQRLSTHKYMQNLLEPLDDPQANIQPNLVTKDGDISRELDRMRVLLARVTAKVPDMDNFAKPATTGTLQHPTKQTSQHQLMQSG